MMLFFCRYQEFPYFLHVLCRYSSSLGKECWPPVIQKGGSKPAQGGSAMDLGAALEKCFGAVFGKMQLKEIYN